MCTHNCSLNTADDKIRLFTKGVFAFPLFFLCLSHFHFCSLTILKLSKMQQTDLKYQLYEKLSCQNQYS